MKPNPIMKNVWSWIQTMHAKEGLKSVESALSSGGGDDKDLGFGKILNDLIFILN